MSDAHVCNPFDYLIDPQAVLELARRPGRLQRLVSHVYRPLERPSQRRADRFTGATSGGPSTDPTPAGRRRGDT
ncbi:hypothetical protein JI739_20945 [Ramlibacter sp. AW1]|uniref:Uncharacterized protein n=1 Tax=Ramlibacter aurantiacus TaxID=2801330 RepID=A0A936ZUI3_9BURK|nr:hypothetical protein [Ramlibacter aurantiacus]MBL0422816.1 hypothetical protein [Ramlibacter aurantiacus]